MMIEGQKMEPEEGPVKVQVVYYLSRAGQLQQPHLIDVTISSNSNGLYLRDVKDRLTAIRGKGVADSFSWSCKRNYKDNFIWQDLTDDDRILPLGDGEFVLKGSGLYAGYLAAGKTECLNGQIDPESTSLSPKQNPGTQVPKLVDQKKFDYEAIKRSLAPENHLKDQTDLAAALSLSLQLISNPNAHLRRFSKDKSMDLNQQVMNSLSQAKAGPAEECTLDRYDMSSNETFLSEDSSTQNNFGRESSDTTRDFSKSTSSSSRNDHLIYDLPVGKQCQTKDRPISADDGLETGTDVAADRQEKPDELPSIKTKFKASVAQEVGDNATFMLSPRRLMSVLSTPERKNGKMLHSTSLKSCTLSNSASSRTVEPMSAMKLSSKATCLSQLRFCSQMSPNATDSRPDSPLRPANTINVLVSQSSAAPSQPIATTQSPSTGRSHSGPYWTRWKPGRKSRSSESKVVSEEASIPSTATQVDSRLTVDRTTTVRRALNSSFEFDMPVDAHCSSPGTPVLPTGPTSKASNESSNPASQSVKSMVAVLPPRSSVLPDMPLGLKIASAKNSSAAEVFAHISVKEVITERLPAQQCTPVVSSNVSATTVKEIIIPPSPKQSKPAGSHSFSKDTASLPRVSLCDSLPKARAPVGAAQPGSPESPQKKNPPCSPIRTSSPPRNNSPAVPLTSPGSFNKRTEDPGRARARGLVKEVTSKDSKFMKDLAKDMERSKVPSNTMRSIVSSKRVSGIKNGTTTVGVKSISSTVNKSPPRISSLLWEEPPQTQERGGTTINRDERPLIAGRTSLDWEKTLQEAASVSLPPPDFGQILQKCPQCGRTFKPDSLKVHKRGCHAVRQIQDAEIMRIKSAPL